jgi:glycosyltransferase involved in cell wall biosynthesis
VPLTKNPFPDKKILVAIIAYNEEANIQSAIQDVRKNAPFADIIVVDDCSDDRTVEIAKEEEVRVISHPFNSRTLGYAAIRTAFMYAQANEYDICCQFDGDGQHDAAFLDNIIRPVALGHADLIIGSRFLDSSSYKPSLPRKSGIRIFSLITSAIIGQKIMDITSGFKANGKRAIKLLARYPYLLSDTNEIIILVKKCHLTIQEVPVTMRERQGGRSGLTFFNAVVYPLKTILYILAVISRTLRSGPQKHSSPKSGGKGMLSDE